MLNLSLANLTEKQWLGGEASNLMFVYHSSHAQVIKLYAWEPSFEEKVNAIRHKEMDTIKKAWYYRAVQFFGFGALPFVVNL